MAEHPGKALYEQANPPTALPGASPSSGPSRGAQLYEEANRPPAAAATTAPDPVEQRRAERERLTAPFGVDPFAYAYSQLTPEQQLQVTLETAKQGGAMTLSTLGTAGGAALGGPVGAVIGGESANLANKALGLQPGRVDEPDLSDALSLLPLGMGTLSMLKRGGMQMSRTGRALTRAGQATAEQDAAYAARVQANLDNAAQNAAHDAAMAEARASGNMAEFRRLQATLPPSVPAPGTPPLPVDPQIQLPNHMALLKDLGKGAVFGALAGRSPRSTLLGSLYPALDLASAKAEQIALRSPAWRAWFQSQMTSQGLSPAALGVLNAAGRGMVPAAPPE